MNPKEVIQKKLAALKAAKSDKKEDSLEAKNRSSASGKAANKKYHDDMPKAELKSDIEEDKKEPQTKTKKADIREDMAALKRKA